MVSNNENFGSSDPKHQGFTEKVVKISRVAKVVKGGRNLSFSAVVVVGNSEGKVGVGMGKASAVPDAVRKAVVKAHKNLLDVFLDGTTIPHEITTKYRASEVMLKPAGEGTGIVAGGSVRAVLELAGIKDISTKARKSTNPINAAKATFLALSQLRDPKAVKQQRMMLAQSNKGDKSHDETSERNL
ncbi:MAG: 30S ribosomal protein S5 [SAR202 cluster bacterium]|nr:30S ribosomal protein S5 [SAR202 cluster bacterium]|tara:strand:- start:16103 stop:16660 length:558 start_codon:yes stop_codon:yes gene_type:complete